MAISPLATATTCSANSRAVTVRQRPPVWDSDGMPMVDLADETFVVAALADVARRLHDPQLWRRWWPELELTLFQDRGERGLRWTVTGRLVGSSEVWLEPWG